MGPQNTKVLWKTKVLKTKQTKTPNKQRVEAWFIRLPVDQELHQELAMCWHCDITENSLAAFFPYPENLVDSVFKVMIQNSFGGGYLRQDGLQVVYSYCSLLSSSEEGQRAEQGVRTWSLGSKSVVLGKESEMRNHQWSLVKSLAFLKRSPVYWLAFIVNLAKLESSGMRM